LSAIGTLVSGQIGWVIGERAPTIGVSASTSSTPMWSGSDQEVTSYGGKIGPSS
jgi:hypothetical protein